MPDTQLIWHKVADHGDLEEGRVKTVTAGEKWICLSHHDGQYGALDNHCPHQGGPLGEGSIENGLLRCPWHGWDYCPLTGDSPAGFDETVPSYAVDVREDGIYVGVEEEIPHERTVSDVMAETMTRWGVRHVFGMVGHSNLGLADALRRRTEAGELEYVAIRHEGAAAFAASAYGKLTGRPAACLTIAGPGATNLLTGLWDAKVDRAPVLALTGQVQSQVFGPGAFQEIDLSSAFEAVAGFSHQVMPHSRHGELMSLAVKHALVERNVSHLIFPDDVQDLPAPEAAPVGDPAGRLSEVAIAPPAEALAAALELLRPAKRPVIVVGHGARGRMGEVMALAEAVHAPVLTTFKAKGLVSDAHPLAAGVLGRSGTPVASWFMNECDLILVFGASFSNHTGITDHKPLVQVDFDRSQLARFHAIDVPVWGELEVTAKALREGLGENPERVDQRDELADRWAIWRAEKARRRDDDRGRGLNSAAVFHALSEKADDDAIIAVDVGNNTYSFGRYFECRDNAVLMSGYLGSIGFGYPAAIGAWAATRTDDPAVKGRQVLCVTGDGGFGQYLAEVTTAVRHRMNITHVLLNNGELGKISKEQASGEWPVWQTDLVNPNFAEFVTSCGGLGIRVEQRESLVPALERALAYDGPATVEIMTDVELV